MQPLLHKPVTFNHRLMTCYALFYDLVDFIST